MQTSTIAKITLSRIRWADVINKVIHRFGG
jgi:hypothetical protein